MHNYELMEEIIKDCITEFGPTRDCIFCDTKVPTKDWVMENTKLYSIIILNKDLIVCESCWGKTLKEIAASNRS